MPTNKNAIIRYQILDECLSDRYHDYTLDDLTAKVNEYFKEINPDHADITRRCIEMDIHFLEYEELWYMEIMRYSAPYYNAIAIILRDLKTSYLTSFHKRLHKRTRAATN